MNKSLFISSLCVLSGCATTQSFTTTMNDFNGQPASRLTAEFGTPDQRIEKDGQTILVFRPIMVNIPVPTPTITPPLVTGMGGTYITPRPSSNYNIRANCQVAFILKNNLVSDWYSQGKDCPSR